MSHFVKLTSSDDWSVSDNWGMCNETGVVGVISTAHKRLAVSCVDGFAV